MAKGILRTFAGRINPAESYASTHDLRGPLQSMNVNDLARVAIERNATGE